MLVRRFRFAGRVGAEFVFVRVFGCMHQLHTAAHSADGRLFKLLQPLCVDPRSFALGWQQQELEDRLLLQVVRLRVLLTRVWPREGVDQN